eukprot:GILJ01004763.1.p1 GENE.GILJ01004763.1~~GILJ01004763.1.p1  ORF type:complete len:455 (-),score=49.25 GILJ01004763.1:149-1468(-)
MRVLVSVLCLALCVVVAANECQHVLDDYKPQLSHQYWLDWNHDDYDVLLQKCLSLDGCRWCLKTFEGAHYVSCNKRVIANSVCAKGDHAKQLVGESCEGELRVRNAIEVLQGEESKLALAEVVRLGEELDDLRTTEQLLADFKRTEYGAWLEKVRRENKEEADGLLLQQGQGGFDGVLLVAQIPNVLDTLADLPLIVQEAVDQCDDAILGPSLENDSQQYKRIARRVERSFGREISRVAASFLNTDKTNWLESCSYPDAVRDQASYAQWLTYYLLAIFRELKLDRVDINEGAREGPGVQRCDIFVITDLLRLGSFHIIGGLHEYFIQRAKLILDHKYHAAALSAYHEAEVDIPAAPLGDDAAAAAEGVDALEPEAKGASFLLVEGCDTDPKKANPAWYQSVKKAREHVHDDQWVSACCAREFGVSGHEILVEMRKHAPC